LIKIIILGENFKWHLEAFASELFICRKAKKKMSRPALLRSMMKIASYICVLITLQKWTSHMLLQNTHSNLES